MAAIVVLLPEPVAPATKINPCVKANNVLNTGGKANSSNDGIFSGITRNTAATPCIW